MNNKFYTYAYLREDGTPYYIGKGTGDRAVKGRHRVSIPPLERIVIIKENITDDEAKALEIELIAHYGRQDKGTGILHNMTDGGDGGAFPGPANGMWGKTHSPEAIKKIKDARAKQILKPLSEETKKILSEKRKGKPRPPRLDGLPNFHTEEAKNKIRQAHLGKPKKKGYKQTEEQKQKKLESFRATMAAKKLALEKAKE